jgi:hypothetical protein
MPAMTLLEIMAQVVLPAIVAGGAGIGGGMAYARGKRPRAQPTIPPPPPSPQLKRSEQIPEWARDTWTRERAEREAAEAAAQAAEIDARRDARERISALERANSNHVQQLGRIDFRLSAIEAGQKESRDVLGTVRDAVLVMRAQCPRCDDSDPAPVVVRGGAAARSV